MKMKNTFLMFSCILFTLLFVLSGVDAGDLKDQKGCEGYALLNK